MKRILLLALCWTLVSPLAAEEPMPPIPMPMDGLDSLPLPVDISQLTPEPLPKDKPATAPADALKALDQAQTPSAKAVAPAPTPTSGKTPSSTKPAPLTPTPTPETPKAVVPTAATSAALATEDYFPAAKGSKWSYEYLKAAPGSAAKKTRVVECVDQQNSDGSITASFQVTEEGKTRDEKYSLFNDKVTRASAEDIVFQFPPKGGTAKWTNAGKTCKSSFGEAHVYKKVYPDCVIVSEKAGVSLVISYYAKGIGLVAVEIYGKGLKLDQTKSIALISGPGGS